MIHRSEPAYTERSGHRMAELKRVRVSWTGWPGGPGVSTFHYETPNAPPLADLRTLFGVIAQYVKSGIVLQVENVGQVIESTTMKAVAGWSAGVQTPLTASGGVNFAAPCGGYIQWKSGVFVGGRESRGKTFMVPLSSSWYDAEGTIHPTCKTAIDGAIATYLAAGGSVQRIVNRKEFGFTSVSSGSVVDRAVVLTSRRA